MISQSKNRVQAIKSKFENLNSENALPVVRKNTDSHLYKHIVGFKNDFEITNSPNKENTCKINYDRLSRNTDTGTETDSSCDDWSPKPNTSYLYSITDVKIISEPKTSLSRQTSDPGKKLHRSHAFRCDRSKINEPKRHGSCKGRSETSDFSLKMGEKKLSKERLKKLGQVLDVHMQKDNIFSLNDCSEMIVGEVKEVRLLDSIPDVDVPPHILAQYAKVVKPKRQESDKQDAMTDSGVSSETENLDDDKSSRIKKLMSQFEKTESQDNVKNNADSIDDLSPTSETVKLEGKHPHLKPSDTVKNGKSNLASMDDLGASSETMKLERKNPHLKLTDTLKKALKQPLPPGPPPKKPPRTFTVSPIPENPEKERKDPKRMLAKLEQVLLKRESQSSQNSLSSRNKVNIYDIAEENLSLKKPKEMHYLCTEILDITQRSSQSNDSPLKSCFNKFNCAIKTNSMSSLPYTTLSSGSNLNRDSMKLCCSCSNESLDRELKSPSNFLTNKCLKCQINEEKHNNFKCHLNCHCKIEHSEFYVDDVHIYDEPYIGSDHGNSKGFESKNKYGMLNNCKMNGAHTKSLEDLRLKEDIAQDQTLYEMPSDSLRPATPNTAEARPISDFQKLRESFENGFNDTSVISQKTDYEISKLNTGTKLFGAEKLEPAFVHAKLKAAKSSENIVDECKFVKRNLEKKFGTEAKRYRIRHDYGTVGFTLPKKAHPQLDMDRENLNLLMNEIYETVSAACNMVEGKPGSFPTEQSDGSTSEESVKLTRSLTEKRKNYVRRVSSRLAYLEPKNIKSTRFRHQTSVCSYRSEVIDNPYSTFRSWKSFRTSQSNLTKEKMERHESTDSKFNLTDSSGNILSLKGEFDNSDGSIDKMSIDEKTGCVDIDLPFEPRERGLFNLCLLVGLNYMTGQAYVKSVFPSQVQVPPHIENLIFPETLSQSSKGEWSAEARGSQCYSLVLTDERGERSYGYCRRVLPEGATTCLPLCYCLIGRYRAPGFYYKVLQEIESHHGSSEVEINSILHQLFEIDFPGRGEDITIKYSNSITGSATHTSRSSSDIVKCQTMPDMRRGDAAAGEFSEKDDFSSESDLLPEFYDLENNNGPRKVAVNLEGPRIITIRHPIEPRVDEDNLSLLLDLFGAGLVIKVFGSLLLERKVVIISDQLSSVSSCMEALQSALYPFVWQQPLISTIPAEIQRDVLEAPLPILAGMLHAGGDADIAGVMFEEGMLIDLTHPSKVLFYQGDESSILPAPSYKTLKTSLQMESSKHRDRQEDKITRNVMISEAFMRFFVDILGDFWRYFSVGVLKEGDMGKGDVVFDKESFLKNAPSKQNQFFLEWFTETAMFNHFVQNMAATHRARRPAPAAPRPPCSAGGLVDTPSPNFYELFDERVSSRCKTNSSKSVENKSNYKSAVNKKVKMLKTKLRDLVA